MAAAGTQHRRVSPDRHSGTAGGVAAPLEGAQPLTVTVVVDPDVAGTRGTQFAAAMLCNILARSIRSVTSTSLACLSTPLLEGVLCGAMAGQDFTDAVVAACAVIGGEPVTPAGALPRPASQPNHLTIGIGNVDVDVTMMFGNWWGGVTTGAGATFDRDGRQVRLPFGAYAAAAHAGAEVFRRSRIPDSEPLTPYVHNLWNQRVTTKPGELPAGDWLPDRSASTPLSPESAPSGTTGSPPSGPPRA